MSRSNSWGAPAMVPELLTPSATDAPQDVNVRPNFVPPVAVGEACSNQQPSTTTLGCDSSDCSYCQSVARVRQTHGRRPHCWLRKKRSASELAALDSDTPLPPDSSYTTQHNSNQNLPSLLHPSSSLLVVPDIDVPQQPSIWDHALLEPVYARRLLEAQAQRPSSMDINNNDIQLLDDDDENTTTTIATDIEMAPTTIVEAADNDTDDTYSWSAWRTHPSFAKSPTPEPAQLHQVACFHSAARDDRRQTADIICGMEFEEHGWLVATAGVAKQIRLYSLASYLENPENPAMQGPIRVHRLSSKLSSLCWNPDQPGVVTVGDYDGVVSQLDLESGHMLAEADEHMGRRIWSVSHSQFHPHLVASASDDGTTRLWQGPCLDHIAAAVRPARGASVCSVHFSPFDGNLLALACADSAAYIYDLRRLKAPLACLRNHSRPASYAKFMGPRQLVTASTDATLAVWNLSTAGTTALPHVVRTFQGHENSKNFVGLSVRADQGLVACGSETPSAYAYNLNWESPLVEHHFDRQGNASNSNEYMAAMTNSCPRLQPHDNTGGVSFCSAVCWQPEVAMPEGAPLLAAATSDGQLRVLALNHGREKE